MTPLDKLLQRMRECPVWGDSEGNYDCDISVKDRDKLLRIIEVQRDALVGAKWDLQLAGKLEASLALKKRIDLADHIAGEG